MNAVIEVMIDVDATVAATIVIGHIHPIIVLQKGNVNLQVIEGNIDTTLRRKNMMAVLV